MANDKTLRCAAASLYKKHAIGILVRRNDKLFTYGLELVNLLSHRVINAYRSQVFATDCDCAVGRIGINRYRLAFNGFQNSIHALMRFKAAVLLQQRDHLLYREGVHGRIALDGDAAVGHDEDDGGAGRDAILVEDLGATAFHADGGILDIEFINPPLTHLVVVDVGDLHEEHVVLVASHLGVGTGNVRLNLAAAATGVEEKVDEHGLASVEDVEKVDFFAVAVGGREVDGFVERRGLRIQGGSSEQECDEDKCFFQEDKRFFHLS